MTFRIRAAAALLAMLPPAAQAADHLAFSNAASPERDIARQAMSAEAGAAIDGDKVAVSPVDLDADGVDEIIAYAEAPFFCNEDGCAPWILRRTGDAWRNVLAPDTVRTRAVPGNFTLVGTGAGGLADILVGSLLLVWDGERYVEDRGPTRTDLDTAAFVAACWASATVKHMLAAEAIADQDEAFCACMADQFETAGLPQSDLDRAAGDYGAARAESDNVADVFLAKVMDFELGCRIDLTAD